MIVSNAFELDIYRNSPNKSSKSLIKNLKNVVKYMELIFLNSMNKELSNHFRDSKIFIEFEIMQRCENSLTDDKPPTFLIVLNTEIDSIWTDLALSSDFKAIINAHLWYAKDMLEQESVLYENKYSYICLSNEDCRFCKDKKGNVCKSLTRYDGEEGELLSNFIGTCRDFRYDKEKSHHKQSIHSLKDYQRFGSLIILNLNRLTGLRLQQEYVSRHLINISLEEV